MKDIFDNSQGIWSRLFNLVSQWYAFLVLGRDMGPSLGAVTSNLTDHMLRGSVPDQEPPTELLGSARNTVYDSHPSDLLGRANRWSAALESRVVSGDVAIPDRTVLTTYGLVSFRTGIRLSIIHYLEPSAIFALRHRPAPAVIAEDIFPVVIRPAFFVQMRTRSRLRGVLPLRGNIWLRIPHNKRTKLGYLTANHAIGKKELGDAVQPDTHRSPPPGRLVHRSPIMDCAVVRTNFDPGLEFKVIHPSSVIGYKPVRLITGKDEIEATVVEHTGHINGVIEQTSGQEEPHLSVLLGVNCELRPGDSGCMVLDCEPEQYERPAVPYAMYRGTWQGIMGHLGFCQFLEQARRQWDLEFCEPWEEEDERKPRIN